MRVSRGLRCFIIAAAVSVCAQLSASVPGAYGHALAPVLLDVRESEQGDGTIDIVWTTSPLTVRGAEVWPKFPGHCRDLSEPTVDLDGDRVVRRWRIDCGEQGLIGETVSIEGLASAYTDGLVRIELADGRTAREVLRVGSPSMVVPEAESRLHVASAYATLGFEHILGGPDHLVFVFGLLLLVHGAAPLVRTITAFTAGHSVTLSLAALGVTSFPSAAVEIAIALSIFALAVELAREPVPTVSLMRERPWLVAGSFGLLHGAGFAGALAEIGLPQSEIPLALLSFNVGIELGQLTFIAGVIAVRAAIAPWLERFPAPVRWAPIYMVGCLSVYWCLDRIAA